MDGQQTGRVQRVLPDKRVLVDVRGTQVMATAHGLMPRPGASVLIANTGRNWAVISWQ